MVALSVADGREVWRWTGDGPALAASPIIATIAGRPQLVFKTKRKIVGVDARTGQELWQFVYRVIEDNTIVTPVVVGDRLFTSDPEIGFLAWQIRPSGGGWTAEQVWNRRDASLALSSPVFVGDVVVGFSHFQKGQLVGLDPADGTLLWRGDPRGGEHATLISWGDHVLVFREDGWLDVCRVSRQDVRSVRKYELGNSICWAHPAVADNRILIRDGSQLAAYGLAPR